MSSHLSKGFSGCWWMNCYRVSAVHILCGSRFLWAVLLCPELVDISHLFPWWELSVLPDYYARGLQNELFQQYWSLCILNVSICSILGFIGHFNVSIQGVSWASVVGSHSMSFICIAIGLVSISYFPKYCFEWWMWSKATAGWHEYYGNIKYGRVTYQARVMLGMMHGCLCPVYFLADGWKLCWAVSVLGSWVLIHSM